MWYILYSKEVAVMNHPFLIYQNNWHDFRCRLLAYDEMREQLRQPQSSGSIYVPAVEGSTATQVNVIGQYTNFDTL